MKDISKITIHLAAAEQFYISGELFRARHSFERARAAGYKKHPTFMEFVTSLNHPRK